MASCWVWLFGSAPDTSPAGVVRKQKKLLQKERRAIDREIRELDALIERNKGLAKRDAKHGNLDGAKALAHEIAHSCLQRLRLWRAGTELDAISSDLTAQLASVRVAGTLGFSAQIMAKLNKLYSLDRTRALVTAFATELDRNRILTESLTEALESATEPADTSDEPREQEVLDSVLREILPAAPKARVAAARTLGMQQREAMKRPLLTPMEETEMAMEMERIS
jgi:hypothetical protein